MARNRFVPDTGYHGPHRKDIATKLPRFERVAPRALPQDVLPILAFDPGGTTGWSLLVLPAKIDGNDVFSFHWDVILRHRVSWEHGQINAISAEDECVYQMARIATNWRNAALVCEDFILRVERKEKSRELLSPVRLTAKFETYMWRQQRKIFLQSASQAKGFASDDRLKIWNCSPDDGLPDHARDADRHALLFLSRCLGVKGTAVKSLAWPHVYGIERQETG